MLSDIEIAQHTTMKKIADIAADLGLSDDDIELYGKYKAKISLDVSERLKDKPNGNLILVTAINPTPAGEGKTTTMIGLAQSLNRLGKKTIVAMREPSLGPCFGIKGGAAGGGYAQVVPMEDINLHFTGDIHAITSANNLIAAMVDNSLHQGNPLRIDPRQIVWKRAVDLNDRALRHIIVGLGGKANGVPREDGFDISVASEIMGVLCLADSLSDLKARIARIIVAYNEDGEAVTVADLQAQGAVTLLLKDALKPNLVQTLDHNPVLIHGGPFANIAHGCNSIIATKLALKLADYTVTEAGFGADLGAEKFFDIKCRLGGLAPQAVVLVATIRALKHHGGVTKDKLALENQEALAKGMANLYKHYANIQKYGIPCLVALNLFPDDREAEIALVKRLLQAKNIMMATSAVYQKGAEGGVELAKSLLQLLSQKKADFKVLYDLNLSIEEKIDKIACEIYGADGVNYSKLALRKIKQLNALGLSVLPICIAKTQYSLSDDPKLLGHPQGYKLTVNDLIPNTGAGFIVALAGDIMRMPGLPKVPAANHMDIKDNGEIIGLF